MRNTMNKWIIGCIGSSLLLSCGAELKLPALFSDGMVLQQKQPIPVWGWADPGETVTLSFGGSKATTTADPTGRFKVRLAKMKASSAPRTLSISTPKETLTIKGVLVGEVWLCSGQSNMQAGLRATVNSDEEIAAASYPLIHLFKVKTLASNQRQQDVSGTWEECNPNNAPRFSAVAYFFGRELQKELRIPVGLIVSAWGSSSVEAWGPASSFESFPSIAQYGVLASECVETLDAGAESDRFKRETEGWQEQEIGSKPIRYRNYAGHLYNSMIHPLAPYGIRGAIWYQGEHDARSMGKALLYRDLLENMVIQWRQEWGVNFPFYAVQLPNFRTPQKKPVENSPWVFLREAFLQFSKTVPQTGVSVAIDIGEADDIRPKNKQDVGYRLARLALAKTYQKNNVPGGPLYRSMEKQGRKIIIRFDDVGSGLVAQGDSLKTFAIAGKDQRFVFAQATIKGNTVVVESLEVPHPVAVRYAWASNPDKCNLFNREGFPASPFRTDDWLPANR